LLACSHLNFSPIIKKILIRSNQNVRNEKGAKELEKTKFTLTPANKMPKPQSPQRYKKRATLVNPD
jgi:hypothetical protein